jgi:predicted outer membrane lipoprotein
VQPTFTRPRGEDSFEPQQPEESLPGTILGILLAAALVTALALTALDLVSDIATPRPARADAAPTVSTVPLAP